VSCLEDWGAGPRPLVCASYLSLSGLTEKMPDMKLTDQVTGHKDAGYVIAKV